MNSSLQPSMQNAKFKMQNAKWKSEDPKTELLHVLSAGMKPNTTGHI